MASLTALDIMRCKENSPTEEWDDSIYDYSRTTFDRPSILFPRYVSHFFPLLSKDEESKILVGIFNYACDGEEPDMTGFSDVAKGVWSAIKVFDDLTEILWHYQNPEKAKELANGNKKNN